jgi:hypothetical protein
MVTFTDIKNPRTVKSVYNGVSDGQFPAHYTFDDRFEEAFGKGIYLKNIKIHMTEDPIISAIENRLLWLSDWAKRGGSISGEIIFNTPPPLEKTLIYRDFLRK